MIDTNELRRLTQEATSGPWVATIVVTAVGVCHKVGPFPGKTTEHPPRHACLYVDYDSAYNPADREIYANAAFIAAANPTAISELLDRLEAAEKDVALKERVIDALGAELNAVVKECDALRAKVEAMEQQEPLITVLCEPDYWSNGHFHKGTKPYISLKQLSKLKIGDNLYTLHGAKGDDDGR